MSLTKVQYSLFKILAIAIKEICVIKANEEVYVRDHLDRIFTLDAPLVDRLELAKLPKNKILNLREQMRKYEVASYGKRNNS